MHAPDGGIQPQAAVDERGNVHVIFYKGDPGGGDIFYVRQRAGEKEFSSPIRVNRKDGSAISAGAIRGAQLAVGKNGRIHIVWNGGKGAGEVMVNGKGITPLLYTRSVDSGNAFEPERNIITRAGGLDGGSSVAADPEGNVYVVWNGREPDAPEGEANRAIFIARSTDDGATFSPEERAFPQDTGACACCGMRAFADRTGAVYIIYRAALDNVNRDETFLVSPRPGVPFAQIFSHPWKANACPMSSTTLTRSGKGALAAWETAGQVFFARINPGTGRVSEPVSPAGSGKRKHPVAVENGAGETLLAWAEGTGWAKGGALVWQVFDAQGKATTVNGRRDDFPVWSLPTAFVRPDGEFVVLY